ncbi:helix-turn-helix domain-containing protein [Granulicella paludicola]|uniref:helix-turn-helix domain-containing protein n=1 Tax=Granulicella paludicola TaxID=474951 RepID=UPI0037BF6727
MEFEKKPPQRAGSDWPATEPYLDTDEAAAILRVHPKTLQRMARKGEVRGVRVGKLWRFRSSDLLLKSA